jgi:adenine phosphoribosyltransferase
MVVEMQETRSKTRTKTRAIGRDISETSSDVRESQIRLVREAIRDVPDFPKQGILFRDITPALSDAKVFGAIINLFAQECRKFSPTQILGIEARGFVIGAAVAARMGVGFVPVRKPGKLPSKVFSAEYELEYGSDQVQMHQDALNGSDRVVIVDDLLATGGTALATCQIVGEAGAKIESIVCLMDLAFLDWREKLGGQKVKTFITYGR